MNVSLNTERASSTSHGCCTLGLRVPGCYQAVVGRHLFLSVWATSSSALDWPLNPQLCYLSQEKP